MGEVTGRGRRRRAVKGGVLLVLVVLVGALVWLAVRAGGVHPTPPPPASPAASSPAASSPSLTPSPVATPTPSPTPTLAAWAIAPGAVPAHASGELAAAGSDRAATNKGQEMTYEVQVEKGLPVDGAAFAQRVHESLSDARSWPRSFRQVESGGQIRVVLASPALVDQLCAPLKTGGKTSCQRGDAAILNAMRWADGAEPFFDAGGTLEEYRDYMVNHEVGHLLSQLHVECPGAGKLAPVMQQQTLATAPCRANGWPRP